MSRGKDSDLCSIVEDPPPGMETESLLFVGCCPHDSLGFGLGGVGGVDLMSSCTDSGLCPALSIVEDPPPGMETESLFFVVCGCCLCGGRGFGLGGVASPGGLCPVENPPSGKIIGSLLFVVCGSS